MFHFQKHILFLILTLIIYSDYKYLQGNNTFICGKCGHAFSNVTDYNHHKDVGFSWLPYCEGQKEICQDQVLPEHQRQPYSDCGETLSMLGRKVRRSRSSLTLCLYHLVDRIQTTVLAQLFSNLTCTLWMVRGGNHWFWVKGQGQLVYSVYKTV